MPWQKLSQESGGNLRAVPRPTGGTETWTEAVIVELRRGRIGLAALPACHWSDGTRLDIAVIADTCHEVGVTRAKERSEV